MMNDLHSLSFPFLFIRLMINDVLIANRCFWICGCYLSLYNVLCRKIKNNRLFFWGSKQRCIVCMLGISDNYVFVLDLVKIVLKK